MDKIYVLIDPITEKVRYVGYTNKTNLSRRLSSHLCEAKRKNKCHRHYWINSLISKGKKPIIKLIHEVKTHNWEYWEIFYIKKYKEEGYDLVNGTLGGDGQTGLIHSEETKKRIRDSCKGLGKGRIFSEEHKKNLSLSLIGKSLTQEHKEKLRVAGFKRIQTQETKDKMSHSHKNRVIINKKPIIGINCTNGTIREFTSIIDAINILNAENIKIHRQQISLIINGRLSKGKYKRTKAGGYYWKLKDN